MSLYEKELINLRRKLSELEADRDSWKQQASDRLDDAVRFAAESDALRRDWNRFHHLMKKHGMHPGRTDDDLLEILDRDMGATKAGLHHLREKNIEARAERDALRIEVERLRSAGAVAVREMGKLTRAGICEDAHHAACDQHAGDATDCPVARRFCDARVSLESAIAARSQP